MMLRVVPEGLAAAAAAVGTLAARLSAAEATAAAVTSVLPPAADPVSLLAAARLTAHGAHHCSTATLGITELSRSGAGVGESATSYASGDAQAAAAYLTARGGR